MEIRGIFPLDDRKAEKARNILLVSLITSVEMLFGISSSNVTRRLHELLDSLRLLHIPHGKPSSELRLFHAHRARPATSFIVF